MLFPIHSGIGKDKDLDYERQSGKHFLAKIEVATYYTDLCLSQNVCKSRNSHAYNCPRMAVLEDLHLLIIR
jgi:hypothetical protein